MRAGIELEWALERDIEKQSREITFIYWEQSMELRGMS